MNSQTLLLALTITFSSLTMQAQREPVKQNKKIEQLFAILNMKEACLEAANKSADETLAKAPQLADKEEETRAFFIKYMDYAASKDDMIRLYEKYYTPEEIDDLIKFHKTSAGKKQGTVPLKIQNEAMALTTQSLQLHVGELNQLLAPSANSKSDSSNK